jgi:hypothetical protein
MYRQHLGNKINEKRVLGQQKSRNIFLKTYEKQALNNKE